MWWKQVSSRH